jgi:hypothetical protein
MKPYVHSPRHWPRSPVLSSSSPPIARALRAPLSGKSGRKLAFAETSGSRKCASSWPQSTPANTLDRAFNVSAPASGPAPSHSRTGEGSLYPWAEALPDVASVKTVRRYWAAYDADVTPFVCRPRAACATGETRHWLMVVTRSCRSSHRFRGRFEEESGPVPFSHWEPRRALRCEVAEGGAHS